ncbi:MAG: NAD-dependent epimerase/dehydratase family protein [Sphingomonas sp.]
MTNAPVKVGMVGAGFILKPHALAVSTIAGAELHAVADTSLSRAQNAAREFGFAQAFGSVEELARSDCDVVHVLVPPFLHLEVAETLLNAGKSVFLEKPMGLSAADCLRLGAIAEGKGLQLGVNHNFLFLPGYERLRSAVHQGALGRIDNLTCNWNFELPQLRSGPFDTWMLSAPANLFFELGPHLAAFVLDLTGEAKVSAAIASKPKALPTGQQAYRWWAVLGESEAASFSVSISTSPGQPERILRVRASGGSAQLDFGRDIYWEERTETANPAFDAYSVASGIARQLRSSAGRDRRWRIVAALRKSLASEPFAESMARSIQCFYANFGGTMDERHHWRFGARTIQFCEDVCDKAGVGGPSPRPLSVPLPDAGTAPATVLVVGGTGFIGRALVGKLVEKGIGVRVLSRSRNAAAAAFAGTPVEIVEGSHGDAETVRSALDGIDTVYHLAKYEGKKWDDYVRGDIEPTRVLAEEAVRARVKRFIYTGTIDSYDSAHPRTHITSATPLDRRISKRNLYARSKAACERVLRDMHERQGLPLVVLRPAIVIGPGADPSHLGIAQFASETEVHYWGTGDNKLPLVLVDDVADALVKAMDAPDVVGRSFVLTSKPMLSARDYVAEVGTRSGVKVRARERSAMRYWAADLAKELAKNLIGHPNRRWPTLHDWRCRAHRSSYDSSDAETALGWKPVSDRDTLVERGIHAAVDEAIGRDHKQD